jgi:hypothetical protein
MVQTSDLLLSRDRLSGEHVVGLSTILLGEGETPISKWSSFQWLLG